MTYGTVCRRCAGDGIGDMPVRHVQLLKAGALTLSQDHKLDRVLAIGGLRKLQTGGRIYLYASLAVLVQTLDRLLAEGYAVTREGFPESILRAAVPCDACHGTGKPNLSVLTMEMSLDNPTKGAA